MYYEIHWLCTLTGKSGKEKMKYREYELAMIMVQLYENFYGELFEHCIIAVY
jgi:hypothetical protein